jgi:hypothetical protein
MIPKTMMMMTTAVRMQIATLSATMVVAMGRRRRNFRVRARRREQANARNRAAGRMWPVGGHRVEARPWSCSTRQRGMNKRTHRRAYVCALKLPASETGMRMKKTKGKKMTMMTMVTRMMMMMTMTNERKASSDTEARASKGPRRRGMA